MLGSTMGWNSGKCKNLNVLRKLTAKTNLTAYVHGKLCVPSSKKALEQCLGLDGDVGCERQRASRAKFARRLTSFRSSNEVRFRFSEGFSLPSFTYLKRAQVHLC